MSDNHPIIYRRTLTSSWFNAGKLETFDEKIPKTG